MSSWEESIGVWLAICTGIVTGLGATFGFWREWENYRQNQVQRLSNAALVAVRRTEAGVVRPLLTARMTDIVNRFVVEHERTDTLRFKTLLFSELYASLRLSEAEKRLARTTATNHLIDLLRTMPSPPLCVKTDKQLNAKLHSVHEQVETAYSVRPRAGMELMNQLGQFLGVVPYHAPS